MKGNFTKLVFLPLILFTIYYLLFTSSAMAQNIWEGTDKGTSKDSTGCNTSEKGCSFCDAVKVTNNIINFLVEVAIPIGVGMIVYGAIRMMANFGNAQYIETGKNLMTNAVIGITITLVAWAIINTILHLISGGLGWPWNKIEC